MPELQEIKRTLNKIEKLEREIHLKQLQINSLLAITQAINENVSSEGLFDMYCSFLNWEIGIRKMALYTREDNKWTCQSHLGIDEALLRDDVGAELAKYRNKQGLNDSQHPLFKQFDLVIPVLHKDVPIAYAFIGDFNTEENNDAYNKVQIITTITNVIAVAIENKRLFKQQLRQEVVNREVELAAEIQRSLVPMKLPQGDKYQLSSIYKPHFAVGGDYYDVIEFSDGSLFFCIADIAGKGVSAALLMANLQAALRTLLARRPSLEELVRSINEAVYRITQGDRYITFFIAKYDSHTRTIHYINSGHTPPLLLTGGEVIELCNGSTVLGWLEELPFLDIGGVCLTRPGLLFCYTDGLTDVLNDAGEHFDTERLRQFLIQKLDTDARDLNTQLLNEIEKFRQRQPIPDDITVLTCKFF